MSGPRVSYFRDQTFFDTTAIHAPAGVLSTGACINKGGGRRAQSFWGEAAAASGGGAWPPGASDGTTAAVPGSSPGPQASMTPTAQCAP